MRLKRNIVALSVIAILVISCSALSLRSAARGGVAGVTAHAIEAPGSAMPPAVPVTGNMGTPAGTQVSVTSPTICRSGPSAADNLVFLANPGMSFQVIGKYTPGDYWIINNPAGGTCWLWGQHATVSGDTSGLPEYPAPAAPPQATASPTPTASATAMPAATSTTTAGIIIVRPTVLPSVPTNLRQSRTCAGGFRGATPIWIEDVTLTWHDSAYETGYSIYENGTAISSIPQNSNSYQIELHYDQGTGGTLVDNFGVEAYNNDGASPRPSVDVPRCP